MESVAARHVHTRDRGYSLVEVLIAMAILGSVLLSIMTLFVFGRRNVYAGKQMTRATAASTHVMEDIAQLPPADFYTAFGVITTTPIAATATVSGVSYTNVIIRKQANFAAGTTGRRYFDNWMALMDSSRVQGGDITLVIMPRDISPVSPTDPTSSRRLIIRTVTEWAESQGGAVGGRRRQVSLDITKLNRKF